MLLLASKAMQTPRIKGQVNILDHIVSGGSGDIHTRLLLWANVVVYSPIGSSGPALPLMVIERLGPKPEALVVSRDHTIARTIPT